MLQSKKVFLTVLVGRKPFMLTWVIALKSEGYKYRRIRMADIFYLFLPETLPGLRAACRVFLKPSAKFAGIDIAARRSWDVRANISRLGNFSEYL